MKSRRTNQKHKYGESTNGLMRHIRSKGIKIHGSTDKTNLILMGYFHGFKGCQFIVKPYESW